MDIKEALEKLQKREKIDLISLIRKFKKEGIETFAITKLEIVETILAELEKKDNIINTMQAEFERLEDLEDNTDILKMELEKKDKIINFMAEWFEEWAKFIDEENYYTIFRKMSKEDIKEYFKKKVEE